MALVSMPAGFDPWFGSVSPKAPIMSPRANAGMYFCFWASDPEEIHNKIGIKILIIFKNSL
jgi:hypothetical protein